MTASSAKPIYLDLGVERRAEKFEVSGRYLKVIEASDVFAEASIGFDTQVSQTNLYTLRKGLEMTGSFERLFISNSVQSGKWLRVIVTDGTEDSLKLDYANETNISGTIQIDTNQKITIDGGDTPATGQVSVTTSATLIAAANADRKELVITNTSSTVDMYIGPSGVTTSTGLLLPPLSSRVTQNRGAYYGVSSSGTIVASYEEDE